MIARTCWLWIVGAVFLLSLPLSVKAQENPYEKNIYMWDGVDGRNLVMVPPSRLRNALLSVDGESPETLGVPMDRWELFVDQLAYSQKPGKKQCTVTTGNDLYGYPHPNKPAARPAPGSRTALGPIQAQPTVIVGNVEAEVASWNFFGSVDVLVFLRIEEILKDESASLTARDLVTILVPWGELEIGPYSLCSHQPEGVFEFELGETFIVTGNVHGMIDTGSDCNKRSIIAHFT